MLLSESGNLSCAYLGTNPAGQLNAHRLLSGHKQPIDYGAASQELAALKHIINTHQLEVKDALNITFEPIKLDTGNGQYKVTIETPMEITDVHITIQSSLQIVPNYFVFNKIQTVQSILFQVIPSSYLVSLDCQLVIGKYR